MKLLWRIVFIISSSLVIGNTACSPAHSHHKKHYTLNIVVDTAANFYLDSVSISAGFRRNPYIGEYIEMVFDSTYKCYGYRFDSVESGLLKIHLQSVLDRGLSKEISLSKDTTIFFSKADIPSFQKGNTDSLSFANINQDEKICIGISSSGCFSHSTEKMIITRKDDKYLIDFFSTRQVSTPHVKTRLTAKLNADFKDSLLGFESSLLAFARENYFGGCTTSSSYHIQKDNTVYTINDETCSGKIRYDKILKMIAPGWFKENVQ